MGVSVLARKLKAGPAPLWAGLRVGFWRRLLSTMLDVLEARLSLVLEEQKGFVLFGT